MSFYLKPPRGLINLHTFENCIQQRLNCYDNIANELEICDLDCLVEDSPLDRTGHYLFRLYAYFGNSFQRVFLENEQKLLLLRLNYYDKDDIKYFLRRLLKHSKECLNEIDAHVKLKEMYNFFIVLSSNMLNRDYLNHIFNADHSDANCDKFTLKVPFYLCPALIVNRDVKLKNGYAEIQCTQWKNLLISIYETYLRRVIYEMKYSQNVQIAVNDIRLKNVFKIIQNHCFISSLYPDDDIKIKFDISNIDAESQLFPLCMLNLYKLLQKTNRLSHNERFDLSLYMKDIGISLSDSIKFWENAYSKERGSCSKCSHNWKQNEKRYIYGIRHLYGLEGSRKNYRVRSCNHFQEKTLCATEDGGCPFKHFGDNNLRQVLKKLLPNKEDDIEVIIYERNENPSESCKLFYQHIFQIITSKNTTGDINFSNPVEYYFALKRRIYN